MYIELIQDITSFIAQENGAKVISVKLKSNKFL